MSQYILVEGACLRKGTIELTDLQPKTIMAEMELSLNEDDDELDIDKQANVVVINRPEKETLVLVRQTDIVVARQYADEMFVEWYFILKDGKLIDFYDGDDGDEMDGITWAFKQISGVVVRECEVAGMNMNVLIQVAPEAQNENIQPHLDEAMKAAQWDE